MDTSLIVSLALSAVLGFWMVGAYNRLLGLRGAIGEAWKQFEEPLRRRHALLLPLVAGLREPMAREQSALDAVLVASEQVAAAADALRPRTVDEEAVAQLRRAEQLLTAALTRLRALLEHHPLADSEDLVGPTLTELATLDERLVFRRQLFNQAVQRYNVAIAQFPTRLLAPLFRFAPGGAL
jgi:LemA protein